MAAAAWVAWILILPTHSWSEHVSNLGLTVMPLVAAWQCAVQARGVAGRLRRGWLLMGGSCLAWGLGMVVWSAYESIGGRDVPFPSLADVGYLATVPLARRRPADLPRSCSSPWSAFLLVALVVRKILAGLERAALQKSVEAWVPPQGGALEDWIPVPPLPRPGPQRSAGGTGGVPPTAAAGAAKERPSGTATPSRPGRT